MKRKKYYCSVRKAIIRIGVYGFIVFLLTAGQLSGSVVFADETHDSDVQTEQEESNTQVNDAQETLSSSEEIQSTSDSKEATSESQDSSAETDSTENAEDDSSAETDSTEDVEAESSDEDVTEDDEDSEEDEEPSNHAMGEEAAKRLVDDPNSPSKAQSITPDRFNIGDNAYTRQDAIDVASYQSWMTPSDFQALRNLGVKGAVVKTTEYTNYTNPYAAS